MTTWCSTAAGGVYLLMLQAFCRRRLQRARSQCRVGVVADAHDAPGHRARSQQRVVHGNTWRRPHTPTLAQ
jgi:hypothetical protein